MLTRPRLVPTRWGRFFGERKKPGSRRGTLDLTTQEQADEVIKMLSAMKVFLEPKDEAAN
ncbi:hypothetical protein [Bradyrhizobium sp. CCBAU 53421]|uniref:hypothetical protein n=1 Tax=Bradyrhizobium sp. CCBAU 53421 TaxID=1325120 RepID=UPI00188AB108|nr:hypothetical protein [Bradyrhizobium sp. CCBAU 53421]QOZ33371.1 hypothetical protein XH92_18220 [Bradyrhizobium sp. CCBAU 53421]